MTLQLAMLNIVSGSEQDFERTFGRASCIIAAAPGYLSHRLQRCVETPSRYLLLVQWQQLKDHAVRFRNAPEHVEWRRLLDPFYSQRPASEHYEPVQPTAYAGRQLPTIRGDLT